MKGVLWDQVRNISSSAVVGGSRGDNDKFEFTANGLAFNLGVKF